MGASEIPVPKIILPTNYSLTLSEGEVVKITGQSTDINNYKIIYAKCPCNVKNAVSGYTSERSYYAASAADLKDKLLNNASNDVDYYVLKDFDSTSTFISQDGNEKNTFYIRTPNTKDQNVINDFYALQWLQNVEPGDLVYIYAIERGTVKIEEPGEKITKTFNCDNWICRCCGSKYYDFWSRGYGGLGGYSPYTRVSINDIMVFMNQYASSTIDAKFSFYVEENIQYPPHIFTASKRVLMRQSEQIAVVLSGTKTTVRSFEYTIPISNINNYITWGYTHMYFNSEWGRNTNEQVHFINGAAKVTLTATKPSVSRTEIKYSNANYNSITKIALSEMIPYIVVPPAPRPIELALKDITSTEATISYTNPLYGLDTGHMTEYSTLGSVTIDVSQGNDMNDLSDLNPVIDSDGIEKQVDNTLNLGIGEKRLVTYEKKAKIPNKVIESAKTSKSNNLYVDLNISSVDNKQLNFDNIINKDIKLQLMFSKGGTNKTRSIDIDNRLLDINQSEYSFKKLIVDKNVFINNKFDTVHLLYNLKRYNNGRFYNTHSWEMQTTGTQYTSAIGWRMISSNPGYCHFKIDTFEIAKYVKNFKNYKIRLCLENLTCGNTVFNTLPSVRAEHRAIANPIFGTRVVTPLTPVTTAPISNGMDITYDIPKNLFDVNYDDTILFALAPPSPYPMSLTGVDFSSAYVEVICLDDDETADEIRYSAGFNATVTFSSEKTNVSNSTSLSVFDPVQCIDVIMCCYDKNKKLINKLNSKRRDIYNGKEFIYYTDRHWHNLVCDKYKSHTKYKQTYDMIFDVPSNAEYMFFIAFNYSNWRGNPSIYSMSNILSANSIEQDFSLEFIKPVPTINQEKGSYYATCPTNNPQIGVKVNAEKTGNVNITNSVLDYGFNLAKDQFNRSKWEANPIIYSVTKKYGYEMPSFGAADLYINNNVLSSLEPLYNDIEFYSMWSNLYGKNKVPVVMTGRSAGAVNDLIDIESSYTIYEDQGDKFISKDAIPYVDIPAELINYDRTKITLFLDTNFGKVVEPEPESKYKLVTEVYEEEYNITYFRYEWGIQTLWTSKMMNNLMDIAAIEDLKIEFGMKLSSNKYIPASGIKGPVITEFLYKDPATSYDYDPMSKYPNECTGEKIADFAAYNLTFKKGEDYKYFEIKNTRIKRLFLECNCHRRRHDPIIFEQLSGDYWNKIVKVRFTVTRKVNKDGSPLYKKQNLPPAHYGANTWVPGWAMYSMPKFKTDNIKFIKKPTASNPNFEITYDVLFSPIVFYYRDNPTRGDEYGNIYKYTWGDNADAYMKWESGKYVGKAPCTFTSTHYYIAYEAKNVVYKTFRFTINSDGTYKIE